MGSIAVCSGARRQRWRRCGAGLLLAAWLAQPLAWDRDRMQAAARALGPRAVAGAGALQQAIVQAQQQQDDMARLRTINDLFNTRIAFAEDLATTGEADHWDTPLELLARGAGDCEDYAIAKYFGLVAAGVPPQRLRLVYVRADLGGHERAHMVLAYQADAGAEPLVLDNLRPDIVPAARRPDLTPVFSFNADGLWQGTGTQSAGDPLARLSRWRAVLERVRAEGFIETH